MHACAAHAHARKTRRVYEGGYRSGRYVIQSTVPYYIREKVDKFASTLLIDLYNRIKSNLVIGHWENSASLKKAQIIKKVCKSYEESK